MIKVKIEAINVDDLHYQLRELLKGQGESGGPVVDDTEKVFVPPKPPVTGESGEKKSVDTVTTQDGSTVIQTLEDVSANNNHSPTPHIPAITENVVELDKDGYPWDERIHSTKKTKTKQKLWKILRIPKRFNDDEIAWHKFINEVKAELKLKEPAPESENPGEGLDDPNAVFNAPTGSEPVIQTFDDVLKYVTDFDPMLILEACNDMGFVNIFELQKDLTRIPEFIDLLDEASRDE